jgi:hypothetical protein
MGWQPEKLRGEEETEKEMKRSETWKRRRMEKE